MNRPLEKLRSLDPESKRALAEKLRRMKDARQPDPSHAMPIAVVSMGCRFPGGATGPDQFWDLLLEGRSGVGRVPADRFSIDDFYDPDPTAPGAIISDRGAFLEKVDEFDAGFFGVSPREARRLDPQHRLLLEVAWEALETAGMPTSALSDLVGGVFIGLMGNDYFATVQSAPKAIDAYTSTGTHYSFAANRLSFHLDLKGPSMAIDSACSSSLVAIHQACQSLRVGDCDFALAGGVNLILSPVLSISYSKWGMLSPDGRCKTFDAAANGFVRGEGVGVVVLKRLDDALAHGDPVLAVVRGSAVNQDGATSVITAPSGLAQQAVIQRALTVAGLDPGRISYVETHGTGTSLGDPIEVEALSATYGRAESATACTLGAVKTNIGHLEGAAGVAGFIKAVLAVNRGKQPANVNFRSLNPLVRLDQSRLRLATTAQDWEAPPEERFAAVSSFGAGGTNAHVIIQGAAPAVRRAPGPRAPFVCLSAKTEISREAQARRLQSWLRESGARHDVADIAYTALCRRNHFEHRVAFPAETRDDLAQGLADFLDKRPSPRWYAGTGTLSAERPVFVFSGQGSQWVGMGRELLAARPRFRDEVAAIDAHFLPLSGWSIAEALASDAPERLAATEIVQPCLFALQLGLVACLEELGVRPAAVVGHSVGEIAAAFVAGLIDLPGATALVFHRARSMQRLTGQGRMIAVGLSVAEARRRLVDQPELALAAINSPRAVVIAGAPATVEALGASLRSEGIFVRDLGVNYAFHTAQVDPLLAPFAHAVREVFAAQPMLGEGRLPMVSTVTGQVLPASLRHEDYWPRNMRETVALDPAIAQLLTDGHDTFVEVGPHPVLGFNLRESFRERAAEAAVVATLRRDQPQALALAGVPAALYAAGVSARKFADAAVGNLVPLPTYAWDHRSYWSETKATLPRTAATPATYEMTWEEAALPTSTSARQSWLIVGALDGFPAAAVAALLDGHDVHVRTDAAAAANWIEGAGRRTPGAVDVVLYLAGGSAAGEGIPDDPGVDLLNLAQALHRQGERGGAPTPRIWVATCGAQAVRSGDEVNPFGATLWGLGRVMSLEAPELFGGLIDLPLSPSQADVRGMLQALERSGDEDQMAVRAGRLHALRLEPRALGAGGLRLDEEGVYLVTGGIRGLGLKVARRLAQRGARHLVLIGRRRLPPRSSWAGLPPDHPDYGSVEVLRALADGGVEVGLHFLDAADEGAMRDLFAELARGDRPLKGIVHAAGVFSEESFLALTPQGWAETLAPKRRGGWLLHELSRGHALDFFALFSSAAAVWGGAGMGAYAAGNEFLAALAAHRRNLGLPATCICWGMWDGPGMASEETRQTWRKLGVKAMAPEQALDVFERLLASNAGVVTVADVDWQRFRPIYAAKRPRPLLSRLRDGDPSTDPPPDEPPRLRAELAALAPEARRERLLGLLRQLAAQVLGAEPDAISPSQGLFSIGFDSITAVELTRHLGRLLQREYPPTVVFDHPTLIEIRDFVLEDCFGAEAAPSDVSEDEELGSLLEVLETMDDAEAQRLLALGRGAPGSVDKGVVA